MNELFNYTFSLVQRCKKGLLIYAGQKIIQIQISFFFFFWQIPKVLKDTKNGQLNVLLKQRKATPPDDK